MGGTLDPEEKLPPQFDYYDGGALYVLATPIGNLGDLAPRAVEILRASDLILAEDTRAFARISQCFHITRPVLSYFDHNEQKRAAEVLKRLQGGEMVALTSNAGTPCISDPGYRLVHACRSAGIPVKTVPGPCAALAALSISGFETDCFFFAGFLPVKAGKRKAVLEEALERECASIFYESPHRAAKTLAELAVLSPDRDIFLARELTKIYEETLLGTAQELKDNVAARSSIKGELVLIVRGKGK